MLQKQFENTTLNYREESSSVCVNNVSVYFAKYFHSITFFNISRNKILSVFYTVSEMFHNTEKKFIHEIST